MISHFAISSWGGSRKLPYGFTQEGIAMLSSVLNSERAIQVNIAIMRVFVRIKEILPTYRKLINRVKALEEDNQTHEEDIQEVFLSIDQLQAKDEELCSKIERIDLRRT